eukprot:CAMPEP_0197537298 /NCGR_PEP_ID=MMETSP1318-20131121/56438_1 /TAXON_ID=552666 /ORGANISM="Partenskyella glossopodia, Strain RCC365" /LENGTH=534 /DNA_ID=CAMNT_0043095433 /DNA_START=159 /DNA_END=1763 /DNA_ORIENTATION=+
MRGVIEGRFSALFFFELNFTALEIGILMSLRSGLSIFLTPVWSALADNTRDGHRKILLITAGTSSLIFLLYYVADAGWVQKNLFAYVFVIRFVFSAFFCVCMSLTDTYLLDFLAGDHEAYGKERMWGAISWGATHLVLGVMIQGGGILILYPMAILTSGAFLSALYFTHSPPDLSSLALIDVDVDVDEEGQSQSQLKAAKHIPTRFPPNSAHLKNIMRENSKTDERMDELKVTSSFMEVEGADDEMPSTPKIEFIGGDYSGTGGNFADSKANLMPESTSFGSQRPPDNTNEDSAGDQKGRLGGAESSLQQQQQQQPRSSIDSHDSHIVKPTARIVLRLLCLNIETIGFFISNFAIGYGMALVENLFFLYYKYEVHASYILCGLSVAVTVACELPLFANGKWLLRHTGIFSLMIISMMAYSTRVVGYTFLPDPMLMLTLEPLHGVTYACMQLASVDYMVQVSPPGLKATGQGLVGAVNRGLGFFVGSVVGGITMQYMGSKFMFWIAAGIVLVAAVIYVGFYFIKRHLLDRTRTSV